MKKLLFILIVLILLLLFSSIFVNSTTTVILARQHNLSGAGFDGASAGTHFDFGSTIGENGGGSIGRSVIEFNLSTLSGVNVTGANFSIRAITLGAGTSNLSIFRSTSDCNYTTVNWNTLPTFSADPSGNITVTSVSKWWNITVTQDVQNFVNGSLTSYGWTLKTSEIASDWIDPISGGSYPVLYVSYDSPPDSTPPSYSNFKNNATVTRINGVVNWSVTLADNLNLSSYYFAHNNTGTLTNGTAHSISGTSLFINETVTITRARGNYICGQFWFNDSAGNINQTNMSCFVVANSPPNTVTITSPYNLERNNTRKMEYNSSDPDNILCFQETATQATYCGGLATGNYNYSDSSGYFYINYSKPTNAVRPTSWQVKHGNIEAYNISIPLDCWNYDASKLALAMYSDAEQTYNSTCYCFNGTWKEICTKLTWGSGPYGPGDFSYFWDGDYDTGLIWFPSLGGWKSYISGSKSSALIWEESIWWTIGIDNLNYFLFINNTLNITTSSTSVNPWNGTDGYYKLDISAGDGIDNSTNTTVYFMMDTTAPLAYVAYPTNESNLSKTQTMLNSTTPFDDFATSFTYYWFINGTLNATTSANYTDFIAPNGYYNLTLIVSDSLQNSTQSTVFFRLDTVAPTVSISYPTNGAKISSKAITLNGSASDVANTLTFYWLVNGTLNSTSINGNSTLNASDGYYNLTLKVSDGLQNGSAQSLFILDTTGPSFSNNRTNSTSLYPRYLDTFQLNLTLTDNLAGFTSYRLAHNLTGVMTNTTLRYFSSNPYVLLENLTNTLLRRGQIFGWQIWANDSAGNANVSEIFTLEIRNTLPTLKTDIEFKNSTALHSFNATATFTDLDTSADFATKTVGASTGACVYDSNTTSGNDITFKFNCTGTALQATTVQINSTDLGGAIINSSQLTNVYPNSIPTMSQAQLNKTASVVQTDDLNCTIYGDIDLNAMDVLTYHYEWYNNSVAKGYDTPFLRNNLTGLGSWYCEAWINDSYEISAKFTSSVVTINSSEVAPTITTFNATTALTGVNSTSEFPTNNNSWINFSTKFTDTDPEAWTNYVCTTPTFTDCQANTSGEILCRTDINNTAKVVSCLWNVSGYTGTNPLTIYSFVLDNKSKQSSKSSSLEVNYPPTPPTLLRPLSNVSSNWAVINFTSSDPDNDIINYTIYNSTNGVTYSVLYSGNTSNFTWTGLQDNVKYYLKASTMDYHGYSLYENSTARSFSVDFGTVTVLPAEFYYAQIQNATNESFIITYRVDSNVNLSMTFGWKDALDAAYFSGVFNETSFDVLANIPKYVTLNVTVNATIPVGEYHGNTTITRTSDSTQYITNIIVGVDPPAGQPQVSDLLGNICSWSPSSSDFCDIDTTITSAQTVTKSLSITNIGQFNLTNCTPQVGGSISSSSISFSPTKFDVNLTKTINITYATSLLSAGSYPLTWIDFKCIASKGGFYSATLLSDNRPIIELEVTQDTSTEPPGGGQPPEDEGNDTELIQTVIEGNIICGNGVCQTGENPLTCAIDCPFGIEELFCWIGQEECPAWVFNFMLWLILIAIVYTIYKRQRGR